MLRRENILGSSRFTAQTEVFASKAEAFDHHEKLIREAAAGGAQIVATQELFLTQVADRVASAPGLVLGGVMAVAPLGADARPAFARLAGVSDREREILQLIAKGVSNSEAARLLNQAGGSGVSGWPRFSAASAGQPPAQRAAVARATCAYSSSGSTSGQ